MRMCSENCEFCVPPIPHLHPYFPHTLTHHTLTPTHSGAALVVTVVGLKLVRSAWTELSRQHYILIFTLFFFNFDYAHLSEGLPLDYFIIAILFNKVGHTYQSLHTHTHTHSHSPPHSSTTWCSRCTSSTST